MLCYLRAKQTAFMCLLQLLGRQNLAIMTENVYLFIEIDQREKRLKYSLLILFFIFFVGLKKKLSTDTATISNVLLFWPQKE